MPDRMIKFPLRPAKPRLEKDIQNEIRAALVEMPDVTLFRNNVGWFKDAQGNGVTYGLAKGSADLIGSLRVRVPDEDRVEHREIARSLAIEVKRPGEKSTDVQREWQDYVRKQGWIVGVCTSVAEAVDLIERARRWEL